MKIQAVFLGACFLVGCGDDAKSADPDMGAPAADAMVPVDPDGSGPSDASISSDVGGAGAADAMGPIDAMGPTDPDGGAEPDAVASPARPHAPGDHDFTLEMDDAMLGRMVVRTYSVHIPASYTGDSPTALLMNLHGGRGSAETARVGSQLDAGSDTNGYIVVYPEAVEDPESGRRWNNGPRPVEPQKEGTGEDVRFIALMLDALEGLLNIDSDRIFVTGISNGGMMSYRLGCEMSDRIAAIAPIATTRMVDPCIPAKPISVIHFHGLLDHFIPFAGGPSDESLRAAFRLLDDLMSNAEAISAFVSGRGCPTGDDGAPATTVSHTVEDAANADDPHAQCVTYGPCDAESEVVVCTMRDGGHTWPGGAHGSDSPLVHRIVGEISPHIDASEMMWAFFQRHPLTD